MNFNTGLLWNFHGSEDYSELYSALKCGSPASVPQIPSGVPPPPPPFLNIAPIKLDDFVPKNDSGDSKSALLSALNVGEDAIKARKIFHLVNVKIII